MSNTTLSPSEERQRAKQMHKEEIERLELEKYPYEEQLDDLEVENFSKIEKRNNLIDGIDSKKSKGKTLVIVGAIAVVGGIAFAMKNLGTGGVVAAIGVLLLILGINIFNSHKKLLLEYDQMNQDLRDYDRKVSDLEKIINNINEKIHSHEKEIASIEVKEENAMVDAWIESISTGHIGMYVSGEILYGEGHREPSAIKYKQNSGQFAGLVGQIYLNDMVYGSVYHNDYRDFEIFEVDEEGTQKLECVVYYHLGSKKCNYETQATPVKLDKCSKFVWIHVQTCMLSKQDGTRVYAYGFDDFESFLKETGITRQEIKRKFF